MRKSHGFTPRKKGFLQQTRPFGWIALVHHLVNGAENRINRRLAEVIPIATIGRSMFVGSDCNWGAIQMFVTALNFKYLLHHIGRSSTRNILIEEHNSVGRF